MSGIVIGRWMARADMESASTGDPAVRNQLLEAAEKYRRLDREARAAITQARTLQAELRTRHPTIDRKTPLLWVAVIAVLAVALLLLWHYAG